MQTLIILLVALLPAVLLWLYIWKKDPHKEPATELWKATVLGILICIPVVILELGINAVIGEPTTVANTTLKAFLGAALPEEAFKLLALWLVLRRNKYFDEYFDGIVYAVCVSLGFAAVENVGYLMGEEEWVTVAIARSLLAVPGHYAFAVLMGYYYSLYHFVDRSPFVAACVLLVPVLAHGLYDAFAMSGLVNEVVGGIGFVLLIFFCIKMHRMARKRIRTLIGRDEGCEVVT